LTRRFRGFRQLVSVERPELQLSSCSPAVSAESAWRFTDASMHPSRPRMLHCETELHVSTLASIEALAPTCTRRPPRLLSPPPT
jgi:hypothetical protein